MTPRSAGRGGRRRVPTRRRRARRGRRPAARWRYHAGPAAVPWRGRHRTHPGHHRHLDVLPPHTHLTSRRRVLLPHYPSPVGPITPAHPIWAAPACQRGTDGYRRSRTPRRGATAMATVGADQPAGGTTPAVLRDYALLADGHRGALIGPGGDVAWLCAPGWSDPPVFSALLSGAGRFLVAPAADRFVWGGHYEPGSLIWRSRWVTGDGIVESPGGAGLPRGGRPAGAAAPGPRARPAGAGAGGAGPAGRLRPGAGAGRDPRRRAVAGPYRWAAPAVARAAAGCAGTGRASWRVS